MVILDRRYDYKSYEPRWRDLGAVSDFDRGAPRHHTFGAKIMGQFSPPWFDAYNPFEFSGTTFFKAQQNPWKSL